jgi:putative modified peptide
MRGEEQEHRIVVRTSREQGLELLGLLAGDDDFRLRVAQNPGETLAEYGIEIDPVPATAQLASKEEFSLLIEAMREGDDPLGRVTDEAWRFQLIARTFALGALPMIGRGGAA